MAGYSGTPLPKKLGIVDDAVFVVVDPPNGFDDTLGDYGDAVWQKSLLAPLDVVVAFFTTRLKLNAAWPKLTKAGRRAGGCGRKLTVPKRIWSPPPAELLVDDEDAVEFMILASSLPTDGAK